MDVDQTSSTSKRSADYLPSTPSFEKRPRILLPEVELVSLKQGMQSQWKAATAKDPIKGAFTISECVWIVLKRLHEQLESAGMKDIVPRGSIFGLVDLKLEELQSDVKKGFEDGDWTSAIGT
jgi:hypothetical protein